MYDYGKMIDQLNLIGLLPQTQLKMTVQLGPAAKNLPRSPYWKTEASNLVVTLPWSSDLRETTRLLSAVNVSLERLGQNTELQGQPFTLTWVLPETLIHNAFLAIADNQNAPKYPEFHNGWYQRESLAWPKVQPQLQQMFGVDHGFDLSLLGQAIDQKGIVGLQLQQVPILANTSTGSQTTSLLWLQAALWGVLGNTLPDDLAQWGTPRLLDPESVRVIQSMQAGKRRQVQAPDDGVHLAGYPQLRLDDQLLLSAALKLGKKIAVLDDTTPVLKIDDHVIAGGGLGNDYAATILATSKPATKALLAERQLPTPPAAVYTNLPQALHDFHTSFAQKAIAIKPTIGHDGQGVRVFMLPPSESEFRQAFTQALQYGPVLIEAYAKGAAYRLFVQDQQVVAAMEVTPANVVGDGRRSIAALVSHKNLRRPLGWQPVVLDEPAQAMLKAQGVTADQVIPRGHQVLLRAASNTRFGADGYDVTDDLEAGYKKLAVQAAQALNLQIAGVDMVIANLYQAYDPTKADQAEILSVTGTPAIWPHAVAQMGKKRDLATGLVMRLG
ncbi:hypothetical protein [Lacticaseibacillus porcinae]|uniref:hypothetical protein n=1 Tax=Lacticaseibacillus porcinae TaxID=1123687 RepID=UPI000F7A19D7|nr:hypothetical protein [Lacticaseibacillus porcinae]